MRIRIGGCACGAPVWRGRLDVVGIATEQRVEPEAGGPLDAEQLRQVDAWWRAAKFLTRFRLGCLGIVVD